MAESNNRNIPARAGCSLCGMKIQEGEGKARYGNPQRNLHPTKPQVLAGFELPEADSAQSRFSTCSRLELALSLDMLRAALMTGLWMKLGLARNIGFVGVQ